MFEDVYENSNLVWKWEMYRLVEEYDKRPGLSPPFVIIEDIYKVLKFIWKKTCRCGLRIQSRPPNSKSLDLTERSARTSTP